jgi:hypothetical protein
VRCQLKHTASTRVAKATFAQERMGSIETESLDIGVSSSAVKLISVPRLGVLGPKSSWLPKRVPIAWSWYASSNSFKKPFDGLSKAVAGLGFGGAEKPMWISGGVCGFDMLCGGPMANESFSTDCTK